MAAPAPPRAAAAVAALLALGAPALGADPGGWWEELGEDGAIWVPSRPPASPAYLPPPDLGAYHNASEAAAALQAMASARPDLVQLTTLGSSVQGRPLLLASVTAPGDASGRTRVLFDGAHHGDEVIASEVLVRFLQGIVGGFDGNATMQALLGQVVVDVVPQVNPDGIARVPTCSSYELCRKNFHQVDLNRNYPDHWGGPGSSGTPSSATYRGPAPLSEPESTAIAGRMDAFDYAIYASLHSGAEMILWPHGWTTASPPEEAMFQALGGELTALTGAPHGQVSKILYQVSGDSMDQAYGSAAGWRAVGISPETYEGSGNAVDWWGLFNPPETEAAIHPVVERWLPFLWHLVQEAPSFRPALVDAPASVVVGPEPGSLAVTVSAPQRRPFQGATLGLDPGTAPLQVASPNPVALADAAGPQGVSYALMPQTSGAGIGKLTLLAGPAGKVARAVAFDVVQLGLQASVAKPVMGTPEPNTGTVLVDAGPFDQVQGTLTVRLDPEGLVLATHAVSVAPGSPQQFTVPFTAQGLASGAHELTAVLDFTASTNAGPQPGLAEARAPFSVVRPDVVGAKAFLASSKVGQTLKVTSLYKNQGAWPAEDLVVRERVPPGYAYWVRDGPVPVPVNPLGSPVPSAFEPGPDGSVWLVYHLGALAPGQQKALQYGLLPWAPGTSDLASAWTYAGSFPDGAAAYAGERHQPHTAQV